MKTKLRLFCAFLSVILLTTGIPVLAKNDVSVYTEHFDENVYVGGIYDIIVKTNGTNPRYQWQFYGFRWENLDDNQAYSGTKTAHLQMTTSQNADFGEDMLKEWEWVAFRCRVKCDEGTFYSPEYHMSTHTLEVLRERITEEDFHFTEVVPPIPEGQEYLTLYMTPGESLDMSCAINELPDWMLDSEIYAKVEYECNYLGPDGIRKLYQEETNTYTFTPELAGDYLLGPVADLMLDGKEIGCTIPKIYHAIVREPDTPVEAFEILDLDTPKAGAALDKKFTVSNPDACRPGGVLYQFDQQAKEGVVSIGDVLTIMVHVRTNDGYAFTDDVTGTWNGMTATGYRQRNMPENEMMFIFDYEVTESAPTPKPDPDPDPNPDPDPDPNPNPNPDPDPDPNPDPDPYIIHRIAETFASPADGGRPPKMPDPHDTDVGYTAGMITWDPIHFKFHDDTSYTATITCKASSKYTFADDIQATINGEDAVIEFADSTKVRISYTFPAVSPSFPSPGGHKDPFFLPPKPPVDKKDKAEPDEPSPEQPDMENKPDAKPQPPVYTFPFEDVDPDAWYFDSVRQAHEMGLINGKSDTSYGPEQEMTVAEAVKLAACMNQLYTDGKVSLGNGEDVWYRSYYDYCLNHSIIHPKESAAGPGYPELMEQASEPISRKLYVYLFSRALPQEAFPEINDIPKDAIPDVPVTLEIWDEGIYLFYRAGILNGTDAQGTFHPDSHIKRSEVAAILIRMMNDTTRVEAPAELQTER